jgi:monovalent cation/hydrogen antiporter
MKEIEILFGLLVVVTALAAIAGKVKIPYPILLVLVGALIGFIPFLPNYELNPDIVFLVFLPPILYSAAWYTSWRDFKDELRPISLLAIGLTLATTTVVGYIAYWLIDGISLPVAFVIGAIVSPPDAVAATSITQGLNLPKRVITILEGESLINDAIGLVAYRFAVASVVTGTFSIAKATSSFFIVSLGGIAIGLLFGIIIARLHKWLYNNPAIETTITILTPFIVYLTAENIHVSGVLAVVTTGLFLTWRAPELFSPQTRLQAVATWDIIIFLLNGFIFLLIGLQLPTIMERIPGISFGKLLLYGVGISISVILIRILWVMPVSYISNRIARKFNNKVRKAPWQQVFIVAWTGLRGVVSLAAAMALPLTIASNEAFPYRSMILFITCCVIFITLVFQGLALPFIIKYLHVKGDTSIEEEEIHARLLAAQAALDYLNEVELSGDVSIDMINWLRAKHKARIKQIKIEYHHTEKPNTSNIFLPDKYLQIQKAVIAAERSMVIQLRREGIINDESLRKIERDLDLEEARLKR